MGVAVLFFCVSSFIGSFFFGHLLGRRGVSCFSILNLALGFVIATYLFIRALNGFSSRVIYGRWLDLPTLLVNWSFSFDVLSSSTVFLVLFISLLIHFYSVGYMASDPYFNRFMAFLSLFTSFMVFLVSSSNLLQFFFAWEGVGICSYLLISFWYTRTAALQAALEALTFNRVGDMFLLLAIVLLANSVGSLEFTDIFLALPSLLDLHFQLFNTPNLVYNLGYLNLVSALLFIGVVSKSAQLGLHVWLPDAMEGPTPVSALLHSSTMVVAGVFLLLRCAAILDCTPVIRSAIAIVGAATAFFAASVGLVQHDIKKVIAYSTCSQLGYMVFACGLSGYAASFYHLFNHAFFKSLLFLASGVVIHALSDEQDMRRMGGLAALLPFTYSVMLIGSFSLSGFPFLSGFYSKDLIIEVGFSSYTTVGWFCSFLGSVSAFLTSLYSFRLLYLVFLSEPRYSYTSAQGVHESSFFMSFPLFILALFSIFGGYFFHDFFVGIGTNVWQGDLHTMPFSTYQLSPTIQLDSYYYEYLPFYLKLFPVFCSFCGFGLGYFCYVYQSHLIDRLVMRFSSFYSFFSKKWYFDYIYTCLSRAFLSFSSTWVRTLDHGWFLQFGPVGVSKVSRVFSRFFYYLQSGLIYHYIFVIILGLLVVFLFSSKFDLLFRITFSTLFFTYICFKADIGEK